MCLTDCSERIPSVGRVLLGNTALKRKVIDSYRAIGVTDLTFVLNFLKHNRKCTRIPVWGFGCKSLKSRLWSKTAKSLLNRF